MTPNRVSRTPDGEHPGPYRGRRNDYRALSEYWAKRSHHYEAQAERLRDALGDLLDRQNDYPTDLSRDPEWDAAFKRGWAALDG